MFLNDKQLKMTTHHELGHFIAWYNRLDHYNNHLPAGNAMSATESEASEDLTDEDFAFAYGE